MRKVEKDGGEVKGESGENEEAKIDGGKEQKVGSIKYAEERERGEGEFENYNCRRTTT
jgi:hypothetical protein